MLSKFSILLCLSFLVTCVIYLASVDAAWDAGSLAQWSRWNSTESEDSQNGLPRTKLAKVTMAFGDLPDMYDRTLALQVAHGKRFGYEIYVLREDLFENMYSKPAYLLSIMLEECAKPVEERLEWLFWFDLDVLVMNPAIPLEIFLPPEPDFEHVNFIITKDLFGLNAGVFFIRVGHWSLQLLTDVLAMQSYKPDRHPKPDFFEQTAIAEIITEDRYEDNVSFVPQRWFNAYHGPRNEFTTVIQPAGTILKEAHWREGGLQVHFAGYEKHFLPGWLNYTETHQEALALPVADTEYHEAIPAFWDAERETMRRALAPAVVVAVEDGDGVSGGKSM